MGREGAKRSREVRVVWRLSLTCLCLAFCTAIHKRWQPRVTWRAGRRHQLPGKAGGKKKTTTKQTGVPAPYKCRSPQSAAVVRLGRSSKKNSRKCGFEEVAVGSGENHGSVWISAWNKMRGLRFRSRLSGVEPCFPQRERKQVGVGDWAIYGWGDVGVSSEGFWCLVQSRSRIENP